MRRRGWPARLGAALWLLAVSFAAVPAPARAAPSGEGLQGGWAVDDGGNADFPHSLSSQLGLIQAAGAGWVRINFRLGGCFPDWASVGCNGRTAVQVYDGIVAAARTRNLQVLGLLSDESWKGTQAQWIANNAETAGGNGDNGYAQAFAQDAAGVLAARYAGQVAAWEVWNEPNAWTQLDGQGNPSGGTFLYPSNMAWLLRRADAAIKAAQPGAIVVSGGLFGHDGAGLTVDVVRDGQVRRVTKHASLAGTRLTRSVVSPRAVACAAAVPSGADYLCQTYQMGVAHAGWSAGAYPLDAVGQHLYVDQGGATSAAKLTTFLQDVRNAYTAFEGGGIGKQTQVTEVGWTTASVSPGVQAANLQTAYATLRASGYVTRSYWFSVQDVPEAGLYYGLADGAGNQKPAFAAYQAAVVPPAPPAVTGVSPAAGPSSGGTAVTIAGSGFSGATAVRFGQAAANTFAVGSDSSITAIAPAGLAGTTVDVTVSTPSGTSAPVAGDHFGYTQPTNDPAGPYHPLTPARIYDTRWGLGPFGPGESRPVQVLGQGSIPSSGVTAVLLNVTVTDASAGSFLTVYPDGGGRPLASNLNWVAGQTVANMVAVAAPTSGLVDVYNAAGAVDVVLDVQGWFGPPDGAGPGGLYQPLAPARVYDTRSGPGALGAGESRTVPVAGLGGVPASGAGAVVLDVAVTNPTAAGYVTVYPGAGALPATSSLNFVAGETRANRVVVAVGQGGAVAVYNATGRADVVIDVAGWFGDGSVTGGARYTAITPARALDTRPASQVGPYGSPLCAGGVDAVRVAGVGGVPASGAVAVVLDVAVTDTTAGSYLTVYPSDAARPLASDLNWAAGSTVPNLVIARLGPDGQVLAYNAAGCANLVVDVLGYFS